VSAALDARPAIASAIATRGLRKVYAPRVGPKRAPARTAPPPAAVPGTGAPPPAASPPAGIVALDALDLDIATGEFFGLLGPNGAGKTTTLGILTTRVRPTAGSASVAGADVVREVAAVKTRIGVVPQQPNPDRSLSVRENLLFHAAYFGIARGEAAERADRWLDHFGIRERGSAKVTELSGGQQQRLMIARALMHDPQVLFLDEPTVGLDPQARLALWDILRDLHAQGRTIVLTTHYMEEADRLCGRLAIIDRGRLLALDTPAALKARAPGGTLLELTLDAERPALADAARGLPGVLRVESAGLTLRVYAERAGETLGALTRLAGELGGEVRNIHLAPPSLETLFVSLTGRKLD